MTPTDDDESSTAAEERPTDPAESPAESVDSSSEPVESPTDSAASSSARGESAGESDAVWPLGDRSWSAPGPWTPRALVDLRTTGRWQVAALVAAAVVGVLLASVHWLGLFLAGALVGLVSRSLPRAMVGGLATGVLVLAVTILTSPTLDVAEFLALTPVSYVTVAAALLAPLWGSLVRGVV